MCLQALLRQTVFAGSVETEFVCRLCLDGVCSQALLRRSVFADSVETECVCRLC